MGIADAQALVHYFEQIILQYQICQSDAPMDLYAFLNMYSPHASIAAGEKKHRRSRKGRRKNGRHHTRIKN
jgi:hypothetical protein